MATQLERMAGKPTEMRKPKCPACRDFGYVLPANLDARYHDAIPAGVLYREGVPCGCPFGTDFAQQQAEWLELTPMREMPEPPRRQTERKPVITPEEEAAIRREIAETAARLSITPKPLVKRELPPLPEHPITAADILREEARNA